MTEIHITADRDVWTGACTTALLCAQQAADGIVISAGDDGILQRLRNGHVPVYKCSMGGFLAALNLSRVLRHIPGTEFDVYVHSLDKLHVVKSALELIGRDEPIHLRGRKLPSFPKIEVAKGDTIVWLGNITKNCGLKELVEDLGQNADKPWQLRVIGQGKAQIVSPILKRTKALGIANRIEWVGYSEHPYKHMNGAKAAIVTSANSIVAHEFAAASIPVYTKLSDLL